MGELCGLRCDDFDLSERTVRERTAVAMIDGTPSVATPRSRRSRRVIDIDDRTTQTLREHRERQLGERRVRRRRLAGGGYGFTTVIGAHRIPTVSANAPSHSLAEST